MFLGKETIGDITYSDLVEFFKAEKEESDKLKIKSFGEEEDNQKNDRGLMKTITARSGK
jgi:hypothetical protein